MEKEFIKKINNNNINTDAVKAYIIENKLYSIRYHSRNINNPSYSVNIDVDTNQIVKNMRSIAKDIINSNTNYVSRFESPLETLQLKLINKPIIIDFEEIKTTYNKTRAIPLKLIKDATYEDLKIYLPNDFNPNKYIELNSGLNNLKDKKDIEFHYVKYGRLRNLSYK